MHDNAYQPRCDTPRKETGAALVALIKMYIKITKSSAEQCGTCAGFCPACRSDSTADLSAMSHLAIDDLQAHAHSHDS